MMITALIRNVTFIIVIPQRTLRVDIITVFVLVSFVYITTELFLFVSFTKSISGRMSALLSRFLLFWSCSRLNATVTTGKKQTNKATTITAHLLSKHFMAYFIKQNERYFTAN